MKADYVCILSIVALLTFSTVTITGTPVQASEFPNRKASTHDWLSDLIAAVFGQDAAAFLKEIDRVLRFSEANLKSAQQAMNILSANGNAQIKSQLAELTVTSLQPALDIPGPVVGDLSLVLPAISRKWGVADVSMIIEAILGKTFEIFLKIVGQAYVKLETKVSGLYNGLVHLAQSEPSFATELDTISDSIIMPIWIDIIEMRDYLDQVVEIPPTSQLHSILMT